MKMVNQDEEHLKLLSILYYIWGGLTAFGCCVGGIYALIGGGVMVAALTEEQNAPPALVGGIFLFLGAFIALLAAAFSVLVILTGRFLARRKHYVFCVVMACLSCLSIPLGTALGIFTLIVLMRPSVKPLFGAPPSA